MQHRDEAMSMIPLRLVRDVMLFAALPALVFLTFVVDAYHGNNLGIDFNQTFLPAARLLADGESPYPAYGYPPLVAFATVPLTLIPGPNVVFAAILIASLPASLWFLGVRDWRCYGLVFLWPPVMSAVQTENVTLLLLLGAAICWHARDRWRIASLAGGLAVAAKILCWPLVVWLAATRRYAAAAGITVVAGVVTFVLWGTLGFDGLLDYPSSLRTLDGAVSSGSYTVKVLLLDVGAAERVAALGGVVVSLGVLVAAIVFGRRGDDARSFAFAATAMIAASPIVWMHSFALLIAAVAVMRPRLSVAWLLPVLMVVGTGTGNGTPWQTAGVLGVAALTLIVALVPPRREARAVEPLGKPSLRSPSGRLAPAHDDRR